MAPVQRTASALRPDRDRDRERDRDRHGLGHRPTERLRHLRVVRPQDRIRRSFRLTPRAGVVMTVALFGGLFAVASSHALLIESQAQLDRLDDQVAEEEARYERQRMEVAELESPERILADAAAQGMVVPEDLTWVSPDQPTSAADAAAADGEVDDDHADSSEQDSTSTSWEDVKPYLGSTP